MAKKHFSHNIKTILPRNSLTCMSPYMSFQLVTLGESLPTHVAEVEFESFVYTHVPSQAAGFRKHFPTCVTHWFGLGIPLIQLFPRAFQFIRVLDTGYIRHRVFFQSTVWL